MRRRRPPAGPEPAPMPWVTMASEPRHPLTDIGPEVLDRLFSTLMVDEEWSVRADRSFTWWPHRLAQHVSVSTPREAFGDPMVALRATTDMVEDVRAPDDVVEQFVDLLNMHASLGAFVWDPEERTVKVVTSAYLHAGNLPLLPVASAAVLLTAIEATAKAPGVADVLEGRPAASAHPSSGMRPEPDELLFFAEERIVPDGQGPSGFVGLVQEAGRAAVPWCLSNADEHAFTGELPYHGTTPALVLAATGGSPEGIDAQTSLVQLLTQPRHPAYGSGLLVLLKLPGTFPDGRARELARELNRAEAAELTGFSQFGAWCADPGDPGLLSFCSFVPSVLARPGLVAALAFYVALRNQWARDRLGAA